MRIAIGVLFLLVAAGFGFYFFATVFMHGWAEGLIRLKRLSGEQVIYGLGMIGFAVVSLLVFLRKRARR